MSSDAQLGYARVALRGDALAVRVRGDDTWYPLTQLTRDTWSINVAGQVPSLTFWRDARGRPEYIATRAGVLRRRFGLQP